MATPLTGCLLCGVQAAEAHFCPACARAILAEIAAWRALPRGQRAALWGVLAAVGAMRVAGVVRA